MVIVRVGVRLAPALAYVLAAGVAREKLEELFGRSVIWPADFVGFDFDQAVFENCDVHLVAGHRYTLLLITSNSSPFWTSCQPKRRAVARTFSTCRARFISLSSSL